MPEVEASKILFIVTLDEFVLDDRRMAVPPMLFIELLAMLTKREEVIVIPPLSVKVLFSMRTLLESPK